MSHTPPKQLSDQTGARCGESLAATMIGHFATRLDVEARRAGGQLSAQAIRDLAEHFLAEEVPSFRNVYRRAYDHCTKARDAIAWEQTRQFPFDRILIKRFAHLFPARDGDDGAEGWAPLSRRLLPGFTLAITKMIGPELHEQCQQKAQGIVERHRLSDGSIAWDKVYAAPATRALVNDILMVVAHYFHDFAKRRDWFLTIANSHLSPPVKGAEDGEWVLKGPAFQEMMLALFGDLMAEIKKTGGTALRERYGQHTLDTLKRFLALLDGIV